MHGTQTGTRNDPRRFAERGGGAAVIRFRSQFEEEWSSADFLGDEAEAAESILVGRLLVLDYEVEVDLDGEFIPYTEAEFPDGDQ